MRTTKTKRVVGTVKRFNAKSGYGFNNVKDTHKYMLVNQTAITRSNAHKSRWCVGEGDTVEFDVVAGEEGRLAVNSTGPDGKTRAREPLCRGQTPVPESLAPQAGQALRLIQ